MSTVVTKMLLQASADLASFGEKNFQQLAVVTRLARDLDIPVQIIGRPLVREAGGLARASRNARLGSEARAAAPALAAACSPWPRPSKARVIPPRRSPMRARIAASGFGAVEYQQLRAADDLAPLTALMRLARLLAASVRVDQRDTLA